ncbi:hypothetical protein [Pseudoroseomonas cervicalis]|uniref:hypothetical protein n=1 Tax=Teichococcus cervicalis TaxID=204525 RepID=UPI0022F1B329|nr:hypothetical protein [Pseudoroseomonas cervicalis]WBV41592.1 hypothetical protein PFY06_10065 [Pseudoroseomonas cervicalis]
MGPDQGRCDHAWPAAPPRAVGHGVGEAGGLCADGGDTRRGIRLLRSQHLKCRHGAQRLLAPHDLQSLARDVSGLALAPQDFGVQLDGAEGIRHVPEGAQHGAAILRGSGVPGRDGGVALMRQPTALDLAFLLTIPAFRAFHRGDDAADEAPSPLATASIPATPAEAAAAPEDAIDGA